jgi:3-oxoacyl-[acyl-carrier protein] reductase
MSDTTSNKPVALVTGSLRGIGRACALALVRSGFRVALNDRKLRENEDLAVSLTAEIVALGSDAVLAWGDIGDLAEHESIVAAAMGLDGRIDCLVNNAGVGPKRRGDLLDVQPDSFDESFQINTRGLFFLTQRIARQMLCQTGAAAGHRCIINITSSNAVAVSILRGEYCAAKAAASMITRLFAVRLADTGIGVYEVRPGIIETDMTRPAKAKYDALIKEHLVPAERWGYPEDVASTVTCMAEGRLRYTVGQAISVDGGLILPRF